MIKNNISTFIDRTLEVIYEDNHLIVVNKRPSDLSQPDQTGDPALEDHIKAYLKEKYNKPGNVFCVPCHRIDRPVSGVLVFGRTSKALARMFELFKSRNVQKTYWAVVQEKPSAPSGLLIHHLKKNKDKNKSFVVNPEDPDSKRAELNYRLLGSSDNYHLIEVQPKTGRHHQIRVQLSHIGCSIKGDIKYGAKRTNSDASIHLHARKIEFIHPVQKENIEIIARPPKDPVWNHFVKTIIEG